MAFRLLRPGGLFVAFTPNGSEAYRKKNFASWHTSWGLVHPQLLDETYYDHEFRSSPRLFASSPYDMRAIESAGLEGGVRMQAGLQGGELLFVARKDERLEGWASCLTPAVDGATVTSGAVEVVVGDVAP